MPRKLTYDLVKNILLDKRPDLTLLSNEYIKSNTPLDFQCNNCDYKFTTTFTRVQHSSSCKVCAAAKSNASKFTVDDIKNMINKKHPTITLLSTNYQNRNQNLEWKCSNCEYIFIVPFKILNNRVISCTNCCERTKTT
jgi:rubredoxin